MPEPAKSPATAEATLDAPVRTARTRSEKLLRECRSIIALRLLKILPSIMDRVDDALFELAEQSDNNTQQSYYFEAMRNMRIERSGIEVRFNQHLTQENDTPDVAKDAADKTDAWDLPTMSLGLVDNDDLARKSHQRN